ncbi:hypothetical protein EL22_28710 [Halostagnicola sp. A56]|uniref:hypothetical protein n=1 Tax=Halostagnicola sp. A56 TaxID=1495067 RepID=UPI00065F69A6|nr:hypothetical protein [Halostagnicola sp. A56]KMT45713.1 hypothetical protein EL22_28710 [Halostagnicola sp. A56]
MIDTQTFNERYDDAKASASNAQEKLADTMPIMAEVRMIGGALVMILLIVYILNEIYGSITVSDGPFSSVVTDLETIGVAALGLLVLALLVIAAQAIMRFFGSSGFGGGR